MYIFKTNDFNNIKVDIIFINKECTFKKVKGSSDETELLIEDNLSNF